MIEIVQVEKAKSEGAQKGLKKKKILRKQKNDVFKMSGFKNKPDHVLTLKKISCEINTIKIHKNINYQK